MRVFTPAALIACAAVLTTACTDTTGTPSRSAAPPLTASVTSAQPASYPNSQKYRDAGFQPATGRSGSAVVSVRALLDRAGTTDVEVTTGTFDEGPATGTLASVQVKGYSPAGTHYFTDNHTDLSGNTASFPYAGLARGTPLQVQTVVRDAGDLRSDVVTVSDAVRVRPDLVASRLEGPAEAPVSAAVNFQAFILERHGELGARADCVLYVGGAAVDRAAGIWVDAGGVVACAMTHAFTTAGTYALEVRVENVRPRDYDETNNAATASISIVEPSAFRALSFQAHSLVDTAWYRNVSTLTLSDGTVETWDQTYTRQGTFQFASFNGLIPRMLAFPITMQGEMTTNGATVNTLDVTFATAPFVDWQEGYCTYSFAIGGGPSAYVCVHTVGRLAGHTHVQYDWWGADVRYHSDSYVTYWDASGELHERWISNDWTQVGPMVTFGPDFSGLFSVRGAEDASPLTAQATVPLSPTTLHFNYKDPGCSTIPVSPGCFELHERYDGVMGFVSYGSWPPFTP